MTQAKNLGYSIYSKAYYCHLSQLVVEQPPLKMGVNMG